MKIHNRLFKILLLIVVTISIGCTTKAWYEGVKQGAENECRIQPQAAMDSCLDRLNKRTYEDYEKERTGSKQ
jgi:hypothetical protein